MTQRTVKTKAKAKKPPAKPKEIQNKLFEDIKTVWKKYAFQAVNIYITADILRELKALKLKDIHILIFPDPSPHIPRLRFTYRGKSYIWCEAFMLEE